MRTYSKNENLIQERRDQIEKSARLVFLKKGYNSTSMRELSEACGLTPGALYRYIGSKSDILHLICMKGVRDSSNLRTFTEQLGTVSTRELLLKVIRSYFDGCDEYRERNIFFNREIQNMSSEDRQILLNSQVLILEVFEEILVYGQNNGEFHVESPFFLAHTILMLGHDWGQRHWLLSKHYTLEQYTELSIKFVLYFLGLNTVS